MTDKNFFSWFQLYKQYILIMFKKYSKISALILFSILILCYFSVYTMLVITRHYVEMIN